MLELLERIIQEKTAYQITTTPSALEVPQLLEQNRFDLIITDLKMPGMDGLDILQLIQEQNRPELVIIITAFGTAETASDAQRSGVFDYLTKPFRKEHLLLAVDRAMSWQSVKRESETLAEIFSIQPHEAARRAFDGEYLRRLALTTQDDMEKMKQQSELSEEEIRAMLESD